MESQSLLQSANMYIYGWIVLYSMNIYQRV